MDKVEQIIVGGGVITAADTDTPRAGWEEWRRCRDALKDGHTIRHICRERCYWVAEPVGDQMTARIVLLTPEIALGWLKRNSLNRSFSRDTAKVLSSEMRNGYWKENGEAIMFDRAGVLIDGQHRLQAVLDSGYEYLVPVITGIEAETRPTVDTGKKRSGAANLQMAGEKNSTILASALMLWRGYAARDVRAMTHPAQGEPERRTSIPRIMEYVDEVPGIREAVTESMSLRAAGQGRAFVPASEAALVWLAIVESGASKSRATEFLGCVLSGFNLTEDSPIVGLRRRLLEGLRPGLRMDKRERLALVLKTWQLWSTGRTRKVIVWSPSEPFPFLAQGQSD